MVCSTEPPAAAAIAPAAAHPAAKQKREATRNCLRAARNSIRKEAVARATASFLFFQIRIEEGRDDIEYFFLVPVDAAMGRAFYQVAF